MKEPLCFSVLSLNLPFYCFLVSGTFLCTLKFIVKDCDPVTGEPDTDQGFDDEYVVSRILQDILVYPRILLYTCLCTHRILLGMYMRGNTLCQFFAVSWFNF